MTKGFVQSFIKVCYLDRIALDYLTLYRHRWRKTRMLKVYKY